MEMFSRRFLLLAVAMIAVLVRTGNVFGVEPYGPENAKITIVVMDPMSLPLACDCVQGYAQRKYETLADYLTAKLGTSVRVVWSESLTEATKTQAKNGVSVVIGKDSVIRADSLNTKIALTPIAQLSDMNGSVMQHGLFVVRKEDSAATLLDLDGYKVLWGPEDCDEKSLAPKAKIKELELATQDGGECASCSIAAKQLIAEPADAKVAAVISSYAEPLLAGCGAIKKGDLRIVGKSDEVPFISAFASNELSEKEREAIKQALLEMSKSKEMLTSLETKNGFLPYRSE